MLHDKEHNKHCRTEHGLHLCLNKKIQISNFQKSVPPPHQPLDNLESVDIVITDLAIMQGQI